MSGANNDTVNIYLNNKDIKDQVLSNSSSSYEKYIILMNDTLQKENRDNVSKIKELEDKIEEMESELGSSEIRNNNIKGLLKNFHEIDKWRREKSDIETEILVKTLISIQKFKKSSEHNFQLLQFFLVTLFTISFYFFSIFQLLDILVISAIIIAFINNSIKNLKLPHFPNKQKRVDEINEEITKTLKAQDYIHEFLDNQ